jgi:cytochrome c oxidase cbb3-type subunit 3
MQTTTIKLKFYSIFVASSLLPLFTAAQEAPTVPNAHALSKIPDIFFEPLTYLWILLASVIIGVFLALTKAIKALGFEMIKKKSSDSNEESVAHIVPTESTWSRLMKAMTRSVPIEEEANVVLDHEYDGIRELDNKLPPWWVWGFYLTIVFSFIYLIHYHVSGSGSLQLEEYATEMRLAALEKEDRIKNDANFVTSANVLFLNDAASLSEGKDIYMKNCLACHGNAGQGGVGPNLTDPFWIHGGGIKNVFDVINVGVPDKGMISWKTQLSPKQIQTVASYILTMQGTNPPDPKEPQGEKWVDTEVSTTTDTLQQVKSN